MILAAATALVVVGAFIVAVVPARRAPAELTDRDGESGV